MNAHFRGRQLEDQPAAANVYIRESQHIAKEGAVRLGIRAVEQEMSASNHRASLFEGQMLGKLSSLAVGSKERSSRAAVRITLRCESGPSSRQATPQIP